MLGWNQCNAAPPNSPKEKKKSDEMHLKGQKSSEHPEFTLALCIQLGPCSPIGDITPAILEVLGQAAFKVYFYFLP